MGKLKELKKRLSQFDPNEVLNDTIDTARNEQFIADLIRKRLYEKGETSTGKKLRTDKARQGQVYAPFTIGEKQRKGQPYDKVTLKDTGSFYKSMEVEIEKRLFKVVGDSDKEDGKIEDNVDLTNVLNLSPDEITKLVNEIKSEYIQNVRKEIRI